MEPASMKTKRQSTPSSSTSVSCSVMPTLCNPWTVTRQAPLLMEFSGQEYWSGLPCPPPGDLPNPGIEPGSPALQEGSLPSELLSHGVNGFLEVWWLSNLMLQRWRNGRHSMLKHSDWNNNAVGWADDGGSRDKRPGLFWLLVFEKKAREGVWEWLRNLCIDWGTVVV